MIIYFDERNPITKETLEKINFNSHSKPENVSQDGRKRSHKANEEIHAKKTTKPKKKNDFNQDIINQFKRKILNPDASSCWLNACLQLILTGLDHMANPIELNSVLGKELIKIQNKLG